jgi:NhaP-type Na+/H+ or K+/H+ antiporter
VIPLIALAIIVYVLYENTLADTVQGPYAKFPLVCAGWLLIGLLIALLVPDLARRIGEGLAREEGMRPAGSGD